MVQRVRSDYNITSQPILVTHWPLTCANRQWFAGTSPGVYYNGQSRVMSDYVIPRFHHRSRAGEKFFNNMYKEEVTVSTVGSGAVFASIADVCPGVKALTNVGDGYVALLTPRAVANSKGHQLPLLTGAVADNDIYRAQRSVSTEVLSKVGTGDSELWESVAEYRQTLALLENPLNKLKQLSGRMLQSAQRGGISRSLMKEVSDGYLLYRYGISPLMKDIKAILASFSKSTGTKEITSRARESLNGIHTVAGMTVLGSINCNWQNHSADSISIRGMSLDRGDVSFANNLGFTSKGLMLLPLQLTTYSFVADWFTNLSSFVGATLPAIGWHPLGSCLVTIRATTTRYSIVNCTNNNPSGITLQSAPSGQAFVTRTSTTRSPLLPASFEMKSNFRFDEFQRSADAIGLIASRFARLGPLLGHRPVANSAFHDKKAYSLWASQPGVL